VAVSLPSSPAPAYAAPSSGVTPTPPIPDGPALPGGAEPARDVPKADPLMDEIKVLAEERPEIVVGAAFVGGILAAMILRRLGN
jgi:hypothetical protein